eukprot:CAMPEP_0181194172 /NCGR_PEP_ID=MMETSP1096-20121128/14199_1 /TAXON_ID=156174 ORGANISM="Chrysochromulina ericina, Strain CCMP281" /NCGR_SAMPLE_ID=MMETSP1096 /ASSEMBLY_ACC=CAM_ASM_000453 /LENGTH=130 /DNA_ID=CAMNT_0023283665 /DNA_START=9 /DNA_END=401 /DNA_ORIENTATION=+
MPPDPLDAGSRTGPTLFTTAEGLFWRQRINNELNSAMVLERNIARAHAINSQPRPYLNAPSKTGNPPTTFSAQSARLSSSGAREHAARNYRARTGAWPLQNSRYPTVDDVISLARYGQSPSNPNKPVPWR